MTKIYTRWIESARDISPEAWNDVQAKDINPFYNQNWLKLLEDSKSVFPGTGWQPLHLTLWKENKLIAIAPLYLKNHSYGEFIFDQPFCEIARRLNLNYYPKLIGMSPYSPVEGYQFFLREEYDSEKYISIILNEIDNFAIKNGILSCNFLYVEEKWRHILEKHNYSRWINEQSLWQSNGHQDFSEYLSSFNSNQRRNIKKERKYIENAGITVSAITGKEIDKNLLRTMYAFYENHCAHWGLWGSKYLTEEFFLKLEDPNHSKNIVLFSAHRGNNRNPIAMSLCMTNSQKLWGRYWGTNEEIKYLHFEVCYYAPIDWALKNGIQSFDPGAGGSQKRRRGFIAKPSISLHRWYAKSLTDVIQTLLPSANKAMMHNIQKINSELPFQSQQNQHEIAIKKDTNY